MTTLNWSRGLGGGLLAWCLGVAMQLQQTALWPVSAYGLGLVCVVAAAWLLRSSASKKRKVPRLPLSVRWALWGLLWAVSAFHVTGLHAWSRAHTIAPALEGQDLDVVGVVQAMPQRQELGWRFRFRIEQAWRLDASGAHHALQVDADVPAQVVLGWYGQEGTHDSGWNLSALPEPVKPGERWRLRVRLKAPHGHLNPRGFDYELWLWEQGIRASGYVRNRAKDPAPQRLGSTWSHPIEAWRQAVRDRLLTQLSPPGSDADAARRAGVVAALVTGDQAAIERSDWDVFRATGVAHLMSISGLHVTMFAWLASALVGWLWRHSALLGFDGALHWPAAHVGALSGLVLATLYALFSGWGVPAQRTLLMLGVVLVLRLSVRLWHGVLVWLTACAVVLVWDPWALLQPGFWLSFVAVGVLMAYAPSALGAGHPNPDAPQRDVQNAPTWRVATGQTPSGHRWGAWAPGAWVGHWVMWILTLGAKLLALLREQATVTLSLAPLTLLFFGQVSLVGLLANLLAIPWVTLVVTPLAMLGVVVPGAWIAAAWSLEPLQAVLGGLASWPMATWSSAVPPWGLALLSLLGAVGLVLRLPLPWKLLCLPLLWPVLFWSSPRPAPGSFELLAADVGQGNAVLVRTATHSLLYDAGPRYSAESDAGHRVLVPLLAQLGERIDTLMLSHRDSDHTGGAAAVLAMQPQAALSSSLEDEHALHALRPGWTRCQAGQAWVWDGVEFEVLHPPAPLDLPASGGQSNPLKTLHKSRPNEVSCVLRIRTAQASVLLAGDIEWAQEQALLSTGLSPVDVLLVPHHGSKTSSSLPFLQTLQPRLALVQAGYRNRFGHPAPEVVARYEGLGIPLVESTRCGAALWRSEAPDQVQCERTQRLRYWHHRIDP
ncbi:DNA internalization-related competence protein ComEC/Rec2 [Limnohabitans sp. Bal53]|uniref:DNA internalization-related competence protein ComEC/Rec2 n=1 Tax=Limnohabitans sp. Bal53 TaxID=1977910 RepID=UPI000D34649C|nr:DNA internalization-related competence protein ComEC/Rec2 [Limnohabitans sp. Bal53]PUE41504.1 DNA internalization-related competence protein ComEC/Rec2 [Limnohabitans sp. Bal53]